MQDLIIKGWATRYKVTANTRILAYIYVLFLFLVGVISSFTIVLIKESYLKSIFTVVIVYLLVGNNLQQILKLVLNMPELFKQSYRSYFKYRFVNSLIINPLLISYTTFIAMSILWGTFFPEKFSLKVCLLALSLGGLLLALTINFRRYLLKVIAYLLIGSIIYLEFKNLTSLSLNVILYLVTLAVTGYLIFDKSETFNTSKTAITTKFLTVNFIGSALRNELTTKIFEIFALCIYSWFALKLNFVYTIILVIAVYLLFENIVYTQIIFYKKRSFQARALFLNGSHSFFQRFLYGNIMYQSIYYLILFAVVASCLLFSNLGYLKLVLFALIYSIGIIIYFMKLEKTISIKHSNRPSLLEEYIALVLVISLGWLVK